MSLNFISYPLLESIMLNYGFKKKFFTTRHKENFSHNSAGWRLSLSYRFKYKILRVISHFIGLILALLFYPVENIEGKGSVYAVVFVKD